MFLDLQSPICEKKLSGLNDALATRTYLVGFAPTLADLIVYATVHSSLAALSASKRAGLVNLSRWANLIAHTCDSKKIFAPVAVSPAPLVLPIPAVVVPAPKAAAPVASTSDAKGEKPLVFLMY